MAERGRQLLKKNGKMMRQFSQEGCIGELPVDMDSYMDANGIAPICTLLCFSSILTLGGDSSSSWLNDGPRFRKRVQASDVVRSLAVVAAADARCSEIGASVLREGGHAVYANVA